MSWLGEAINKAPLELFDHSVAERDNEESERTDTQQSVKEKDGLASHGLWAQITISYNKNTIQEAR